MSMNADIGAAMSCIVCDRIVKFPDGSLQRYENRTFNYRAANSIFKKKVCKIDFYGFVRAFTFVCEKEIFLFQKVRI